jgi:prepilin-type N-terminal cleavage/methylation domain-containing protein
MRGAVKKQLLWEESGFTLVEVLVTTMLMLVVLFALYSIFDMSMRVFSFGNDKVEAVENARLGLEKMEREIRAAYPYDKTDASTTNDYLFPAAGFTSSSITFGNERNGNYRVDSGTEQITYSLSGGSPSTLLRNGEPVVEYVQEVDTGDGDATPLTFKYFTSNGSTEVPPGGDEAQIAIVRIKLEVAVDRGLQDEPVTQVLTTDIALRNRGG